VSIVLGVVCLACTYDLVRRRRRGIADAVLLTALLGATPLFVIAATTSIDYLYGLSAFLAGWTLLERDRSPSTRSAVVAGVLFGLATAGRITYAPLGLLVLLLGPGRSRPPAARKAGVGALMLVGGLAYLPAFISAHESLSFLGAQRPTGEGWYGLFGRAVAKGAMLLGLVGTALAVVAVVIVVRRRRTAADSARTGETWMLATLAVVAALWIWLPVEPSYLLPGLAIGLVWISGTAAFDHVRNVLLALLAALVMSAWIEPDVFKYSYVNEFGVESCAATEASGARLAPHVNSGTLLRAPHEVERNRPCNEAVRRLKAEP
jgi:hypothetical protein